MKKLTGAITALITPFKENEEIDVEALVKIVEWQIRCGVNGLVPCGSTGEAATLRIDDYRLVVKTVVDKTAGRVPVIAGATSNNTKQAIEYSKIAKAAGADMLLHATPYYNKPTLPGLIAHYKAISSEVNLPIVLYNVPGRTGLNLTAQMTLTLVREIPRIVAIKEASGDITQIMNIIKDAPKNFSVLSGDDSLTFSVMALGGNGIISVASNEIPKEFSLMVSAALSGNWEKARRIHFEWVDLMDANFIESNPIPVKTALSMMGKIKEVFRLPLVSMQDKNRAMLKEVLKKHKLI